MVGPSGPWEDGRPLANGPKDYAEMVNQYTPLRPSDAKTRYDFMGNYTLAGTIGAIIGIGGYYLTTPSGQETLNKIIEYFNHF